jgi:pilus assembly protein CpaB
VLGKYALADLAPGDYILTTKLSNTPVSENAYLYNLKGDKQAISVSIKNFAGGLSGKLISGDIVSVIAPDYKKRGLTVIPPELTYVEVIGVTASTGYDTDTGTQGEDEDAKQLPATVTLLISPEQAKILAELEADGKIHLSLVYRGSKESAAKFTELQDKVIENLYPKPVVQTAAQQTPVTPASMNEDENPVQESGGE